MEETSAPPLPSSPSSQPMEEDGGGGGVSEQKQQEDQQEQQEASSPAAAAATATAAPSDAGVSAARLNDFFVCPQCRGYFWDPHVVTCCLSTFCKDCVVRVLRTPDSACPGCGRYMGVTLPQRTRPDPQLQAVMLKLFPDMFAGERAREAAFWRDRAAQGEAQALYPPPKDRAYQGPTTSAEFAAATAKWLPREDGAGPTPTPTPTPTPLPSPLEEEGQDEDDKEALGTPLHLDMFVLCSPEPAGRDSEDEERLPALPLPYLRLQRRTQVGQLRQVLADALGLEGGGAGTEGLELVCRGAVLTAQHSLHFVDRTLWRKEAPPLHLHYRRPRRQQRE